MSNQWLNSLKACPDLLKEIYQDAAKPGVQQAGKALEAAVGLGNTALLPIALLNAKARNVLEKNLEKYRRELEQTPIEDIVSVPPEVGVPIVEKLSYVTDEQISDLYINLLAKASTVQTAPEAHPSFANIVSSLSPDEALLLQRLSKNPKLVFITAKFYKDGTNEWVQCGDEFLTGIEEEISFMYPQNHIVYISNFEGLGILRIRRDIYSLPISQYEALEVKYRAMIEPRSEAYKKIGYSKLQFDRGRIDLSPFGALFAKACVKKLNSDHS